MVRLLPEHGASTEATDNDGVTLLHHAAVFGNTGSVTTLPVCGADIQALTIIGKSSE